MFIETVRKELIYLCRYSAVVWSQYYIILNCVSYIKSTPTDIRRFNSLHDKIHEVRIYAHDYCVTVSTSDVFFKLGIGCINLFINTHLNGSILGGCDHDREDGVEYDACDRSTVPTQGISLWRAGDPFFGVSLLTHRSSMCHLLLCFIQLWLQLHHLQRGEYRLETSWSVYMCIWIIQYIRHPSPSSVIWWLRSISFPKAQHTFYLPLHSKEGEKRRT